MTIPTRTIGLTTVLPSASDLSFMLSLRRAGVATTWEHNDMLEAIQGVRPEVSTTDGIEKPWGFLRADGTMGVPRLPQTTEEAAMADVVRHHDAEAASSLANEAQEQSREQSLSDLEALATAPKAEAPPTAPDLTGLAQMAQGRQTALRKATVASGRASPGMGTGRTPGIAERAQRPPMAIGPAFLLRGR